MDSQKTVVDGQLITIHNDSDDQVKTSLDMSASSSAKKRRAQRKKQSDENNITLQTLNFFKAAHEERKQLQMQSEQTETSVPVRGMLSLRNFWMF